MRNLSLGRVSLAPVRDHPRIAKAFAEAEQNGLRIAIKCRLAALALLGIYFIISRALDPERALAYSAAVIGFVGGRSYALASALVLIYGGLIWLDSSSLTAGAAGSAEPHRRGATLALHSMLGYFGGFLGPLVIGWILDASGGMSTRGWGLAFLHVAVVIFLGRIAFIWLGPRSLAGDRVASPANV